MVNYFIQADVAHKEIAALLLRIKEQYPEVQIWEDMVLWDSSELDAEIIGG